MEDCVKYQKGCKACQRFGNIQLAPISVMNSTMKSWPFRGWGVDLISEIHLRGIDLYLLLLIISPSGLSSTIEEHDTPGGNMFCAGTHYLSVWSPSNSNNQSGAFIYVAPI
jgi:hypothetical protein